MNEYRQLLHVVAENPGVSADEIENAGDDISNPIELLGKAAAAEDVVCVSDRYWIVRKGEFAYDQYDYPDP